MKKAKPVCVFTSDIHANHIKPRCRKEKDWFEYQKEKFLWLNRLCSSLKAPLVAVGDVFETESHPPKLINLVIDNLPDMYVTCGNHDLKYHSRELLHKTAYGVLIKSRGITELNEPFEIKDGFVIHPYHFGEEYDECPKNGKFNILIGHELIWSGKPFPGAPEQGHVDRIIERAPGYDLYVFGDNHHFFKHEKILNNGSLFRLTAKQLLYQPKVHVLYDDGTIDHIDVPVEGDMITREHLEVEKRVKQNVGRFVSGLRKYEGGNIEDRLKELMNDSEIEVCKIIEEEMEKINE